MLTSVYSQATTLSLSPSMPQSGSAGAVERPLASGLETGSGWSAHHDRQGSTYLVFRTRQSNVTVWMFGSRWTKGGIVYQPSVVECALVL